MKVHSALRFFPFCVLAYGRPAEQCETIRRVIMYYLENFQVVFWLFTILVAWTCHKFWRILYFQIWYVHTYVDYQKNIKILMYILPNLDRLFPKTRGLTHERSRTNHVKFMKIGSKLRPVSCVFICTYIIWIYISINIADSDL